MVGAGDDAEAVEVVFGCPLFKADDVLVGGAGEIECNHLALGEVKFGAGFTEDIHQPGLRVAAANQDGFDEAIFNGSESGFYAACAAGEGDKAIDMFRNGGERFGEKGHVDGETEQIKADYEG